MVSHVSELSSASLGPFIGVEWPDVHVLAFGAVAPAHVLGDQDERVLGESPERPGRVGIVVRAVRFERVGRAREQDRPGLGIVLGKIDAGEEPDAVAHRDAVLELGVMFGQPGGAAFGGLGVRSEKNSGGGQP